MPNLASNKSFYIDLILCDIILKTAKINDNSVFLGHGISIIAETFCWEDMKLCRTRLIVIINSMIANSHIKETFICLECIWVLSYCLIIIMQTLFQLKKKKAQEKVRIITVDPKELYIWVKTLIWLCGMTQHRNLYLRDNNKWGCIIRDNNFNLIYMHIAHLIRMAGLIKHPHILEYNLICIMNKCLWK